MKKLLLSLLFLCVLPGAAHAAITDNVQGSWKLDESSGDAADASPNAYTLGNFNTTTYGPGKINNAGIFSAASSQHLSIADASAANLKITGDISMAAWIYITSTPSTEVAIINKFGTGGNAQNGYTITIDDTDRFNVYTDNSSDVRLRGYYNSSLSLNTWYCVVGVAHTAGASIDIYINSVSESITYYDQNAITIQNNTQPFNIGSWTNGGSYTRFFDGDIDTPTVWSRAISSAEATQFCNGTTGSQYPFAAAVTAALHAFIFNAYWLR